MHGVQKHGGFIRNHSFPHSFIQAISGGHWAFEPRAGAEGHDTRVLLCAARRLPGAARAQCHRGSSDGGTVAVPADLRAPGTAAPPGSAGTHSPVDHGRRAARLGLPRPRPGPPCAGCSPSRHACLVVLPRAQPRTRSAGSLVGFRCLTLRFVQSADEIYKKSSVNSEP